MTVLFPATPLPRVAWLFGILEDAKHAKIVRETLHKEVIYDRIIAVLHGEIAQSEKVLLFLKDFGTKVVTYCFRSRFDG